MMRSTWTSRERGRRILGGAAVAVLVLVGCRAPQSVARRTTGLSPQRSAGDDILHDQDFWAEAPSPSNAAPVADAGAPGEEIAATLQASEGAAVDGPPARGSGGARSVPVLANLIDAQAATADGVGSGGGAPPAADGNAATLAGAELAAATDAGAYAAGVPTVVEVQDTPRGDAPPSANGAGMSRIISNFKGALQVPAGRSIIVRLARPAERVAISDPEVAEVVVISPQEVLINGKGRRMKMKDGRVMVREAQTSVIVWDREGRSDMRTLYVNRSRSEQILLEVTVAELNRTALEAYGLDFAFNQSGHFVLSDPAKIVRPGADLDSIFPGASQLGENFGLNAARLTAAYGSFDDQFVLFLEALQQEALAKILARPVVLARSGEQAHLRVGGEVPVVYATANVATITFKEFGVIITMTPEYTDNGQIDISVQMEVSEPTSAFATSLGGFDVPSFIGRRAETRVILNQNETLLIGGLYRETTDEAVSKIPYLGDIPWLGFAFRSTKYNKVRTETVMTLRPRVAASPSALQVNRYPSDRGPLTRDEVRTQPNPNGVTRPRIARPPLPPPPPDRSSPADHVGDAPER